MVVNNKPLPHGPSTRTSSPSAGPSTVGTVTRTSETPSTTRTYRVSPPTVTRLGDPPWTSSSRSLDPTPSPSPTGRHWYPFLFLVYAHPRRFGDLPHSTSYLPRSTSYLPRSLQFPDRSRSCPAFPESVEYRGGTSGSRERGSPTRATPSTTEGKRGSSRKYRHQGVGPTCTLSRLLEFF